MAIGLDDVIAAETTLSDVDGLAGRLTIRGHLLDDLAGTARHEDVLGLLWAEQFADTKALDADLGGAREEVFARLRGRLASLADLSPFDALRAAMAALPDGDDLHTALLLDAAPAVLVPAWLRQHEGQAPVAPDATLGHAADVMHMLRGKTPAPGDAEALDTYPVTVSDHGLNASTFAARVVASTGAGLLSSTLAALGALKGPLHGGAPGPVLDLLDEIGTADRARDVLSTKLDRGERLMGFGHRIYRVRDPRADALKAALTRLRSEAAAGSTRLELALSVEQTALALLRERKPDRPLETNVEFFTALLLDALGFPRDAFTAVFAMGRIGGWIAHAREQARTGRLIRPRSRYIGPLAGGPTRDAA